MGKNKFGMDFDDSNLDATNEKIQMDSLSNLQPQTTKGKLSPLWGFLILIFFIAVQAQVSVLIIFNRILRLNMTTSAELTIVSILSYLLTFMILVIIIKKRRLDFSQALNIRACKNVLYYLIPIVVSIPMQLFIDFLDRLINKWIHSLSPSIVEFFDRMSEFMTNSMTANNYFEFALLVLAIAVLPAIFEEIFFRGFMQSNFQSKFKPTKTILLTSLLFGVVHGMPLQIIFAFVIGLVYSFVVYKTKSIIPTMIAHFINNLVAVIIININLFT